VVVHQRIYMGVRNAFVALLGVSGGDEIGLQLVVGGLIGMLIGGRGGIGRRSSQDTALGLRKEQAPEAVAIDRPRDLVQVIADVQEPAVSPRRALAAILDQGFGLPPRKTPPPQASLMTRKYGKLGIGARVHAQFASQRIRGGP
jgi:hypothetical protein